MIIVAITIIILPLPSTRIPRIRSWRLNSRVMTRESRVLSQRLVPPMRRRPCSVIVNDVIAETVAVGVKLILALADFDSVAVGDVDIVPVLDTENEVVGVEVVVLEV